MKKVLICLSLVFIFVSGVSWAGVPTGKIGVGAVGLTSVSNGNSTAMPTIKYFFNDRWGGELLLNFSSMNANNVNISFFNLGGHGLYNLSAFGNVIPQIGGEILLRTNSRDGNFGNAASTVWQLGVLLGAEIFILPMLSFDITTYPLIYSTGSGGGLSSSGFGLFSTTYIGAHYYF